MVPSSVRTRKLDSTPEEFFVFVNLSNPLVRHNLWFTRSLSSGGDVLPGVGTSNLFFTRNPQGPQGLSFFQATILNDYLVEYSAERVRLEHFSDRPSRLNAVYAFGTLVDAERASQLYGWPMTEVLRFRLVVGVAFQANMQIVSFARLAYRTAQIDEDLQKHIWAAYWTQKDQLSLDLPDGPNRRLLSSGCLWEYLVLGRLELIGELTEDMRP